MNSIPLRPLRVTQLLIYEIIEEISTIFSDLETMLNCGLAFSKMFGTKITRFINVKTENFCQLQNYRKFQSDNSIQTTLPAGGPGPKLCFTTIWKIPSLFGHWVLAVQLLIRDINKINGKIPNLPWPRILFIGRPTILENVDTKKSDLSAINLFYRLHQLPCWVRVVDTLGIFLKIYFLAPKCAFTL